MTILEKYYDDLQYDEKRIRDEFMKSMKSGIGETSVLSDRCNLVENTNLLVNTLFDGAVVVCTQLWAYFELPNLNYERYTDVYLSICPLAHIRNDCTT